MEKSSRGKKQGEKKNQSEGSVCRKPRHSDTGFTVDMPDRRN